MNIIISTSLIFLLSLTTLIVFANRNVKHTIKNFLFANQALPMIKSGLAISSHWFWAIAIFVGPAVAYNWGLIGLLWFAIPNGISCLIVGWLAYKVRSSFLGGFSLTQYIKKTFSFRIAVLYQIEFVLISLAALLLAFTAINKIWAFAGLGASVTPFAASLLVGAITLIFTMVGGIRTSIFTGSLQTILWITFILVALMFAAESRDLVNFKGKNDLDTVWNEKFLTSFAVAFAISILVGASSHGMMWQKAFSMPKRNIMPSFAIACVVFIFMVVGLGMLAIYAFDMGLPVTSADTSQLAMIQSTMGIVGIIVFSTVLVGQTSTVIDSSLNYISSLITLEWIRTNKVIVSRLVMAAFMTLAWLISWAELEIWTILMLMSAIRIVMFVPLILHVIGIKIKEKIIFYTSLLGIVGTYYFAFIARSDKLPIFDMYSAIYGVVVPFLIYLVYIIIDNKIGFIKK